MEPSIGRIVTYRSRTGNYSCPAIITATVESLWPEGVERGEVPALSSPGHVHLHVFTPGGQGSYAEHDVPFDHPMPLVDVETAGDGPHTAPAQAPRSWRWPVILRESALKGGA